MSTPLRHKNATETELHSILTSAPDGRGWLNTGYEEHITKTKISYLLYIDDLKLMAKSEEELRKQIQTIHMDFGLEKCAKTTFKKGKLTRSQDLVIDINREIQELEEGKTYKYLGRHTSTNEGKIETGIQKEIKNDTEI